MSLVLMNDSVITIHIQWKGPYSLSQRKSLKGPTDYGVYQLYGGHPVYGRESLLYIGLACDQRFGTRIGQEWWWKFNRDADQVKIYCGRLAGSTQPEDATWNRHIKLAERLLISSHYPPFNSQKSLGKLDKNLWPVHIMNWGNHRDLMPEVSGARWTSRYDDIPNYHVFKETDDSSS